MRRRLKQLLFVLLLIPVLVLVAALVYLWQSLPEHSGTVVVSGVSGPVEIIRDRRAIPHIFATSENDALFGLGYVHAQDRLWQMDSQRRIASGRLSEVFGEGALLRDRFLTTVGFGRAARASWASMPEPAKQRINAYVAGINAFIAAHRGSALPLEFSVFRVEPQPFTGADVVGWGKVMAWDLAGGFEGELLKAEMLEKLGAEKLAQILPGYPQDAPNILGAADLTWLKDRPLELTANLPRPAAGAQPAGLALASSGILDALARAGIPEAAPRIEGLGSNNWVVSGARTTTGRPILANDPHLGARIPSTWYLAHLSGGSLDVIGATIPGMPGVILGRNRFIAWGCTNTGADVQDLFRERLDPSGKSAEFKGAFEPIEVVTERIPVRGREPFVHTIRFTRHGPIISDGLNEIRQMLRPGRGTPLPPISLRWTGLEAQDRTVTTWLGINEAKNWGEFVGALRNFVIPMQNFVYADVDGHIGYYAPGKVPIRAGGNGSLPVEGWTGANEWTGFVPFELLPHAFDPPQQFIVTANHRPAGGVYPYYLGADWVEPYRAKRIAELLQRNAKTSPADHAKMQADTVSLHARVLLPVLMKQARPAGERERAALERLRAWDGDMRRDSPAATIFQSWLLHVTPAIVSDELGSELTPTYIGRMSSIGRFLPATLATDTNEWCDDSRTPSRETCGAVVSSALTRAVADLTERIGEDMDDWQWEKLHKAVFSHQGLDPVPVLGWLLRRIVPTGGDEATVNTGPVIASRPFMQVAVVSYRQVVDLGGTESRYLDAVGQSAHPLSRHYDDFLDDWQAVRHHPMELDRAAVERTAASRLRLEPTR